MNHGPNVNNLIVRKMVLIMVPPGGGVNSAIRALTKEGSISSAAREAEEWVVAAIAVVKTAPDNPYGNDDEAIAREILRQILAKEKQQAGIRRRTC